MQSQKWQNDLSLFPKQTIQHHSNPSLCPNRDAKEAEVDWFYEDLQDILELTPKKRCLFHHTGLGCKSRKSRDTKNNRQVWPWSSKWSREKANRVLYSPWGHRELDPLSNWAHTQNAHNIKFIVLAICQCLVQGHEVHPHCWAAATVTRLRDFVLCPNCAH